MDILHLEPSPARLLALALLLAVAVPLLLRWHLRIRREGRAALARDRARRANAARQVAHDREHGIQVGATQEDVRVRGALYAARVAAAAEAPMIEAMRERLR